MYTQAGSLTQRLTPRLPTSFLRSARADTSAYGKRLRQPQGRSLVEMGPIHPTLRREENATRNPASPVLDFGFRRNDSLDVIPGESLPRT